MTNTNSPGIERPLYFQDQMLTAQDFADEQDYFRQKLRRHNRLLHGWGVVCGLRVTDAPEGCAVVVSPGYALDPCGDEILVEKEERLGLPRARHTEDGATEPRAESKHAACPDGVWYVAIRYAEIPCEFVPALGKSGEDDRVQPSRIRESYELRALPAPPAGYKAGRVLRQQILLEECSPCPPDPDERWVVLGEVRVEGGRIRVRETVRTSS
jgi:hypothetical protein